MNYIFKETKLLHFFVTEKQQKVKLFSIFSTFLPKFDAEKD